MKIHEIRNTKTEELKKLIDEEERNLVDLRFAHQLKQLTNTAKLKITKKELARMKTILRERELEEQKSAVAGSKEGDKA
jgi:large subunit ribosomal protein L29